MNVQTAPTKSERLTVLLSRDDKRAIEQRARAANLSVGEYVRRASQSYDPELDHETLEAVVNLWHENVLHMRKQFADTFAYIDKCRAEMNELRKGRDGTR